MDQRSPAWPDGAELLARHAALVRGEFDMTAHQTRYTRQHSELVPGMIVVTEKFQRSPSELLQKLMATDGSPLALNGYDGSVAWEMRDDIARLTTGAEADALKSAASFYEGLLSETVPRGLVTVAEFGAGDAGAFALTLPGVDIAAAEAGGFPIAYISKSTGLLASMSIGGGKMPWFVRQTFGSYRDFGGLLVATELTTTSHTGAIDFKHAITIDEVRWDCVSEQELELPAEVRALLKS
jgi:hypothetical protein